MRSDFKNGDVVIKARSVYPNGALVVDGRDPNGRLLAHPLGGGPQYAISTRSEAELRIVTVEEQSKPLWRRARFSLEGLEGGFEGWTTGKLWNGWDMPFFESKEAERLTAHLTDSKPRFDEMRDAFITVAGDEEEVWAAETVELLGGQTIKVYPIGAGSWCWEEAST
jgi:hypothetical protein